MSHRSNLEKLALCILVLVISQASLQAAEFSAATNYSVTADPISTVVGDFNGDGNPDIAFVNTNDHVVSVMLCNGDGTLQTALTSPAGISPAGLAAGDMNHDGKLDLVFTDLADRGVGVLLGNGDGTFQSAVNSTVVIAEPYGVAVADLNGDGKLDVAVTNLQLGHGSVFVMLGNGDGTFSSTENYSTNESYSAGLAIADFDNDGFLDLAVANSCSNPSNCTEGKGTVSVFRGNGNGTFQPVQNFTAGFSTSGVVVADFNNDGNLDLAACNEGEIGVLLGHGDATFGADVDYQPGSNVIEQIAAVDVNGDGIPDLVSANTNSNSVSVLLGKGNGTFFRRNDYPVSSDPFSLATGDLNGDGFPDIVAVGGFFSGVASVLLNTGGIALAKISPHSLDFGHVQIHTISPAQSVTLRNTGTAPLNISGIRTLGGDSGAFHVTTNTCGTTLAVGGSCTVSVQFGPVGRRSYASALGFADDAVGHRQTVSLTGIGTP